MRTFFRAFFALIPVAAAFAGGWFSSATLRDDPILAKAFNLSPGHYEQLIQDIVAAVEDSRLAARLAAVEAALASAQSNPDFGFSEEGTSEEGGPSALQEEGSGPETEAGREASAPGTGRDASAPKAGVLVIDPGRLGQQVYERMPNREKMAFMLWLRSKFDEQELNELKEQVSRGLTGEDLAEIYRRLRQNMTERDYEYILAIVDKYLLDSSPSSQPYVEAGEREIGLKSY